MILTLPQVIIQLAMNFGLLNIFQSDAISTLEKQHDFKEEHFDFIQQHIRKFCLHCILIARCLIIKVYG